MTNITATTAGFAPVHPGQILAVAIEAIGKPKSEIADLLKISRQSLYDILSGKQAVTPTAAVRIGKLIGNGPDIWLRLQQLHDLRRAEIELADVVASIPTLEVA